MWKIVMKYFQNVVDIVRDLMSATGVEKNYKQVWAGLSGYEAKTVRSGSLCCVVCVSCVCGMRG